MKALVLYHSQEYGNTAAMADAVAEGLRAAGCDVAFGSPDYYSYVAGGLKQFMDDHYILDVRKGVKGLKGKPYALFYSHGGGGRVIDAMRGIFQRVGTQVGEPVGSRGYPSPGVLEQCRALGDALARAAARR